MSSGPYLTAYQLMFIIHDHSYLSLQLKYPIFQHVQLVN